ncbi:MAG TPA: CheR family methyltransferase, partial [Candidatus Xenobia bacterium]
MPSVASLPSDGLLAVLVASDEARDVVGQVLSELPPDTRVALLVQGLSRASAEELASGLRPRPVAILDGNTSIEAGRFVVVPAGDPAVLQGATLVHPAEPAVTPLDDLLMSLLEWPGLVSVWLLGGQPPEGLAGLQALRSAGAVIGRVPSAAAESLTLPAAAEALGCVDVTLLVSEVAAAIAHLAHTPPPGEGPLVVADQGGEVRRLLSLLTRTTGVDFGQYKRNTFMRRIARRMAFLRMTNLADYVRYLETHQEELQACYDDVLISVTSFFRDPQVFDALQSEVLPRLVDQRLPDQPLRAWVAGCSTGQEAYSLAMCILEFLSQRSLNIPVQIFATDVNERSIATARAAIYPSAITLEVSPERLQRFFTRVERGWQISKPVRDLCIFARQNLAQSPPFSKLDLLSCRNVLIYMGPALQQRIMPTFHYALKPTGFLLLGNSEAVGRFADMFTLFDKKHKIYGKKTLYLPHAMELRHLPVLHAVKDYAMSYTSEQRDRSELSSRMEHVLLDLYAPPAVVINQDFEILHFRGRTGRYLEAPSGPASLNLLKHVRPGLLYDLRSAVQQAAKGSESVPVRRDVALQDGAEPRLVHLEILPMPVNDGRERCYLVTFRDTPPPAIQEVPPSDGATDDDRVAQLMRELSATKDYLRTIIEEHQTTNEELNSANEEVHAANEELQSTNEELETAKEELQSTNEELTTLNEELFERNSELSRVNDDLQNLLASVNLPILMLDTALCIRRFTPVAQRLFNVIQSDVGRPIREVRANIEIPDLEDVLADVINNLATVERQFQFKNRLYMLRIRPYKTADNKIDGAVLMLVDLRQYPA